MRHTDVRSHWLTDTHSEQSNEIAIISGNRIEICINFFLFWFWPKINTLIWYLQWIIVNEAKFYWANEFYVISFLFAISFSHHLKFFLKVSNNKDKCMASKQINFKELKIRKKKHTDTHAHIMHIKRKVYCIFINECEHDTCQIWFNWIN